MRNVCVHALDKHNLTDIYVNNFCGRQAMSTRNLILQNKFQL